MTANECEQLRQAFKAGVRHFERREFPEAVEAMTRAMGAECGEVVWVWGYGRWRYRYTPGVYLGVSTARAADCEQADCSRPVDWWEELAKPEAILGWVRRLASRDDLLQCRACAESGDCRVEVHWWQKLASAGESVTTGLVRSYADDCAELRDSWLDWFGWKDEDYAGMCHKLVGRLGQTTSCTDGLPKELAAPAATGAPLSVERASDREDFTEPAPTRPPVPRPEAKPRPAPAPEAATPSPPAESVALPESERVRIETAELIPLVEAWAAAWSRQDADAYLSFYSSRFSPPGGQSRSRWEAERRDRLGRPGSIRVSLIFLDARLTAPDRGTVRFVQTYESDTYSDRVTKRMELARKDGAWKILSEKAEP